MGWGMLGKNAAHYRIDAELGRGGMGVVYRARDMQLQRTVALKVLSEEFARRGDQRGMILAEARAAAALNHPGVTTIMKSVSTTTGYSSPWSLSKAAPCTRSSARILTMFFERRG